jgi:hypothetical protein
MREFLAKLQSIDRRVIYALMFVVCAIPFVKMIPLPVPVTAETRGLYDAIEKCPKDKVVLLDCAWDQGSLSENKGQTVSVMEHMFRRGVKFILIAIDVPLAPPFAEQSAREAARNVERKYGIKPVYGRDWVSLGYKRGGFFVMQLLAKDFRQAFPVDRVLHKKIQDLPITRNVRDIDDIYLVYCITYQPNEQWISFIHGPYGTLVAFGCAAIVSSNFYPYLDSGQLVGMLAGVRGAAEYEALVGSRGLGSKLIVPQAFGHTLIIVFVLMGNIGYAAMRRKGGEGRA